MTTAPPPAATDPPAAALSQDQPLRAAARVAMSPDGHADDDRLQQALRLLRTRAPVYWVDTPEVRPFWLISRHADVMAVERRGAAFAAAPRSFLNSRVAEDRLRRLTGRPYVLRGLLQMDADEHTAYRAVTQPWFTPAALAELEPRLTGWAEQTVAAVAGRSDTLDFVPEVAVPFAMRGIMHLLGLPAADDALIRALSYGLVGAEDPHRRLADQPTQALCRAAMGFRDYFAPVAADRRSCPRDDLSSAIANARIGTAAMPDYELFSYYMVVATAGHDTITFCLGGGLQALLQHPDQFARLRAEPALLDTAIEEIFRWTTPGRHVMRTATRDTEIGGRTIREGEAVALFLTSANRDEAVFPDAGKFRVDRRPNPHIAFGLGRHHCLGAHLARLQMRALLQALLPRLIAAEMAGPVRRTQSTMVSGVASLPIRFTWSK